MFHQARDQQGLPLKRRLRAVYASFLDQNFTMQIGLLLVRLEQPFAVSRLRDVSSKRTVCRLEKRPHVDLRFVRNQRGTAISQDLHK